MNTHSDLATTGIAQPGARAGDGAAPALPRVREFAYERVAAWTQDTGLTASKPRARLLALVRELPLALTVDGFEATFAQLASKGNDTVAKAVCEAFGQRMGLDGGKRGGLDLIDKLIELQNQRTARDWKVKRADLLRLADELKYFADALLVPGVAAPPSADSADSSASGDTA